MKSVFVKFHQYTNWLHIIIGMTITKCILVLSVLLILSLLTFSEMAKVSVHWFRHGLRFHDNPALLEAVENAERFYAVFIFDGETAGEAQTAFLVWGDLTVCIEGCGNTYLLIGERERVRQAKFLSVGS